MTQLSPPAVSNPYTSRPARLDDMPGVHQVLLAIAAVQPHNRAPTLGDVQRNFADPWSNPETDTQVVTMDGGTVVAYAHVLANPDPAEAARAYLNMDIHPAHSGRGLEERLLDWLEARGAERLQEIMAAHTLRETPDMMLHCWETEADRIALYQKRGFQPVRHSYRMRRDLSQPLPEGAVPHGLRLAGYRPEIDERIRQAFNESFSDGWGFEPASPLDWQLYFVQSSWFRPDLSFAILEGDEVAAFSMNRFDADEAQRTGIKAGWIGTLGTRRPWRKRGLASTLLIASMRAFQAAGLDYAGLGVDAQNPTGALRLYAGLGFKPYIRGIRFQKSL